MLFWQPLACFSQWSPSSFVVDDVSYSSSEQFMVAEKGRFFQDYLADELIVPSAATGAHERIGRGVRNSDKAVWDCVRDDEVFAGNFANLSQTPTMTHHLVSTGTKSLAKARPIDPVWGIGLRAGDPKARDLRRWRGNNLLGKALSTVRDAIRTS